MSYVERLAIPVNSPEIITPLETFREGLESIFTSRDRASFVQSEEENTKILGATYLIKATGPTSHKYAASIVAQMWVPSPDGNITIPNLSFIRFSAIFSDEFDDLERRETVTSGIDYDLNYELDEEGLIDSLKVITEDRKSREVITNNGIYRSARPDYNERNISNLESLRQRLPWALRTIHKAVEKAEQISEA